MNKALLFLLLAFSLCFAEPPKDGNADSLKKAVNTLKAEQMEIKRSLDSLNNKFLYDNFVTVKILESSQKFYNDAFNNLLFKVSIILCVIGILVAVVGIFLGIVKSNKEKEFEKLNKDFVELKEEMKKEFNEKLKIQTGKLKEINAKINKIENQNKILSQDIVPNPEHSKPEEQNEN